jgi:hypothetical protein
MTPDPFQILRENMEKIFGKFDEAAENHNQELQGESDERGSEIASDD